LLPNTVSAWCWSLRLLTISLPLGDLREGKDGYALYGCYSKQGISPGGPQFEAKHVLGYHLHLAQVCCIQVALTTLSLMSLTLALGCVPFHPPPLT
jgi:hypothetical protein